MRARTIAFALIGTLPSATVAQSIAGNAAASDGDSLIVDGQKVRLFGIDAPELSQTCQRDGEAWACGKAAQQQLAALVMTSPVQCRRVSTDHYGRVVAVCHAGSEDLNRAMVENGWAIAYREYSLDYEREETQAKIHGLGIWSSTFQRPSDFRQVHEPKSAPPDKGPARPRQPNGADLTGCVIKGNRNRRGQWIYHLPGMPYYAVTRPEEIFCAEAEALAAGYRRAIVTP